MNVVFKLLKSLPSLTRISVSLAVSFSAITGYIVYKGQIDFDLISCFIGVLLLAGGASALNQYQEKHIDILMDRTKGRPIPSHKITPQTGLITSLVLCAAGLILLYFTAGFIPAVLGFFNLIWYNGLYTSLKRKTAFAVVPGSLTGVTPVLIGWTAAGGYILHPAIIFISFFIYMWQVPHFWLLLIKYNDDYKNAGLGTLYESFSNEQAKRIVYAWILATSLTSLLLPYFGIIHSAILVVILILLNIWLVISFYKIIFNQTNTIRFKAASIEINLFMVLIMLLLILNVFV